MSYRVRWILDGAIERVGGGNNRNYWSVVSKIKMAEWSTQYVNDLPDGAFIIIEPAYREGKTRDKRARHLPVFNKSMEIDLPHLRNALARVGQIEPVTDSIGQAALRNQAERRLTILKRRFLNEDSE